MENIPYFEELLANNLALLGTASLVVELISLHKCDPVVRVLNRRIDFFIAETCRQNKHTSHQQQGRRRCAAFSSLQPSCGALYKLERSRGLVVHTHAHVVHSLTHGAVGRNRLYT
jgi:hypothetical protein